MAHQLSSEDADLDVLWRRAFGQPLPLLGASEIVREILRGHGVEADMMQGNEGGGRRYDDFPTGFADLPAD